MGEMVEYFKALPLTHEFFKRRGFYRLQQLEYLHSNGIISDDLFWLKDRPAGQVVHLKRST